MTAAAAAPWQFDAIGTRWQIQTASPLGEAERTGILDLIDRFDRDWSRFRPDAPAVIDVGALGKGRLVDVVADHLLTLPEATAEGGVVVDAGGDIRVLGAPAAPERIALEHPYDPSRAVGVWQLTTGALCASAVNRRAWGEGLHHVLDARTGEPVRQVAATWALAPTAMLADALATALFFDGGAELAHRRGVEWVRMTTSGRLEWTPGAVTAGADLFVGR